MAREDAGRDGALSPSRNIGCYLTTANVRCDGVEWSASTSTDTGHGLAVSRAGYRSF